MPRPTKRPKRPSKKVYSRIARLSQASTKIITNELTSIARKKLLEKKMTDIAEMVPPAPLVTKGEDKIKGKLIITRDGDGSSLKIFFQNKTLGEIVKKMAVGNYDKEVINKIYHAIVAPVLKADGTPDPAAKNRFSTRPALAKASTNLVQSPEFSFTEKPSTILFSNPQALIEGFTLVYKVDSPIPPDTLKKWGKWVMDACNDVISNARPFRMSWAMEVD